MNENPMMRCTECSNALTITCSHCDGSPASTPADAPTADGAWACIGDHGAKVLLPEDTPAPTADATGEAGEIVARVLELDAKATPGPWEFVAGGSTHGIRRVGTMWDRVIGCDVDKQPGNATEDYDGGIWKHIDADLIVEYRTAAPQLAHTIVALRDECARLRDRLAHIDDLTCDVKPDEDSEASGTIEERVEALVRHAASRAGTEGRA